MELAQNYANAILALGSLAALMLCQLLVADVIGIRFKHVPGSLIPSDHENPLFRASRVVANTNESIVVFVLAVLFCMLSGASASTTGYAAWAFVVARFLYAFCYYCNWQLARSAVFGISLVTLAVLLVSGFSRWL